MMRCRCVERPGYPWGRLRLLSLLVVSRFLPAHTTGAPVGQPPGLTLTPMAISPQVPESVPWGSRLHLSAAAGGNGRGRAQPGCALGLQDGSARGGEALAGAAVGVAAVHGATCQHKQSLAHPLARF